MLKCTIQCNYSMQFNYLLIVSLKHYRRFKIKTHNDFLQTNTHFNRGYVFNSF